MNGWGKKSGVEQVVVGSGSVMQLSCPYATRTSHSPSTDGRLSRVQRNQPRSHSHGSEGGEEGRG